MKYRNPTPEEFAHLLKDPDFIKLAKAQEAAFAAIDNQPEIEPEQALVAKTEAIADLFFSKVHDQKSADRFIETLSDFVNNMLPICVPDEATGILPSVKVEEVLQRWKVRAQKQALATDRVLEEGKAN